MQKGRKREIQGGCEWDEGMDEDDEEQGGTEEDDGGEGRGKEGIDDDDWRMIFCVLRMGPLARGNDVHRLYVGP